MEVERLMDYLQKPEPGNPYFNKRPKGYSPCILGNNSHGQRDKGLNVLPNCVGAGIGLFNMAAGNPACNLVYIQGGNNNAKNLIANAKKQGLVVTREPALYGLMVWTHPVKAGHCAFVAEIKSKTQVVTSESEWNGAAWQNYTRIRGNGNWRSGCKWMGAEYGYLGCINQPEKEDEVTQDDFNKMMAVWMAEQKKLPADSYAAGALAWAKETGIMAGDASGNQMPQALIKREDVAVMLQRLYKLITSR